METVLYQALTDCESFCWMPGVLAIEVGLGVNENSEVIRQDGWKIERRIDEGAEYWPVIDDPATRGCLLALIRKCGFQLAHTRPNEGLWTVWCGDASMVRGLGNGRTEGEALARALLEADRLKRQKYRAKAS